MVLGGGLTGSWDFLGPRVLAAAQAMTREAPRIELTPLGDDAGLLGASALPATSRRPGARGPRGRGRSGSRADPIHSPAGEVHHNRPLPGGPGRGEGGASERSPPPRRATRAWTRSPSPRVLRVTVCVPVPRARWVERTKGPDSAPSSRPNPDPPGTGPPTPDPRRPAEVRPGEPHPARTRSAPSAHRGPAHAARGPPRPGREPPPRTSTTVPLNPTCPERTPSSVVRPPLHDPLTEPSTRPVARTTLRHPREPSR